MQIKGWAVNLSPDSPQNSSGYHTQKQTKEYLLQGKNGKLSMLWWCWNFILFSTQS